MRTDILSKLEELLQQEDPINNAREFKSLRKLFEKASEKEKEENLKEQEKNPSSPENDEKGATSETVFAEAVEAVDGHVEIVETKAETEVPATSIKAEDHSEEEDEHYDTPDDEAETEVPATVIKADDHSEDKAEDHSEDEEDEHHETPDDEEEHHHDEVWEKYTSLVAEFNAKFSAAKEKQKEEEDKNLKIKKDLLSELKDLIENEENIGKAFAGFNEIQEKWKNVGSVSNDDYRDLNTEYNRFVELFFYNINIYKELKEYDLKHNLDLKKEILEKQKNLVNEPSIKKMEKEVRENQDKWNSIGPTFKEEWEKLKDEFWTYTRECYKKIQDYYDEKRGNQQENLGKKKVLVEEAKKIDISSILNHKKWQEKSKELIDLQEQWKKSGFVPKDASAEVWKEFRGICDNFFAAKRAFYDELHKEQDANKLAKENLVSQAEQLKSSDDWKKTSNDLIRLQKEWKQIGNAHQRDENKLWKKFRSACDAFFQKKKEHFAGEEDGQKNNLTLKEALIAEVKEYEATGDKITDLEKFKEFSERWRSIGFVPFKHKDRIHTEFTEAINSKYGSLKIDKKEKQKIIFEEKLENLKDSQDAEKLLGRERSVIRNKIDKIKSEVIQLENNLGFFANSKGADAMKKSVEDKIENLKKESAELKEQLRMVNNA